MTMHPIRHVSFRTDSIRFKKNDSKVKYSDMSDKSNEADRYNGSDSIELASARETIVLSRNESEGFGFVIMSSPR